MYKKNPLASAISLAIAASSLGVTSQVLAQEEADAASDEEIENIVVTGSRIKRDGFSTSAPMDVVLTNSAAPAGISDLGTLIQQSTVAATGPQVTPATSTAFVENGGTGANTLSIRGLGANRTLTLVNGRRAGPAGTRGSVSSFDLNVMPLIAVERIEILKDGASSIYGSDAVAGVVNIFTRKDDGGAFDAYVSQPTESGGEETRISATWGKTWSRGNFRLTADYAKTEELRRGQRDYFECAEQYIFDAGGNRVDLIDPRIDSPACDDLTWGHVWLYDYQGAGGNVPNFQTLAQYDYDGDLAQYIPELEVDPTNPDFLVTPPGWFLVDYDRASDAVTNRDHPFQQQTSLIPEIERTTFWADVEFDVTDTMTLYGEALLNRRETTANSYRQFWGYVYNGGDFFGVTNSVNSGWAGLSWFSPTAITDRGSDEKVTVDYERYVAGLRGEFGEDWSYDLSFQYSKSDGDYVGEEIYGDSIYDQNWLYDYGGLDGSCANWVPTTSIRGVPCQDIPWLDPQFLAGNISPAMQEYLFGMDFGNTVYKQSSWEAFVTGPIMQLPAGDLGVAFGFHIRDDDIHDVPGEIVRAGNAWGSSSAGITSGDQNTKAVFAEVDIPILADRAGFYDLSFTGSYRYNDVDTYGTGDTYKVGLNWAITDTFRLRGTQGTSFRTPALFELYLADETEFLSQRDIDPCRSWGAALARGDITQRVADNCAAETRAPDYPNGLPPDYTGGTVSALKTKQGNIGELEAETSTSTTVGFVWQPAFADLSLSVDYFDIEIEDQITSLEGAIVTGCYSSQFFGNEPLCDLFDRSGINGGVDNIQDRFLNVASQVSNGYDIALRWVVDIGDGTLEIDTQHTLLEERNTALFPGNVQDNLGRFGHPEHVGRLWTTYDWKNWSFFWGVRFVGDVSNTEDEGGPEAPYWGDTVYRVLEADALEYHDLSVTYHMDSIGLRAIVGVSNALDQEPPQVSTFGGLGGPLQTAGRSALYSQYDWLGRRYFVNFTFSFDQ